MTTWSDVDSTAGAGTGGRTGQVTVRAHHGEFLQGVFPDGRRLVRGLISVPCDLYSVTATFTPAESAELTVEPRWKNKAHAAAELALRELGMPCAGGHLEIAGGAPLRRGFGSSTSDVLGAILAVYDAFAETPADDVAAVLAIRAEQASDSIMFERHTVLFAHLEGVVIEDFHADFVPLGVLGFGTSEHGLGVDTIALSPARYSSWEIEQFRVLRALVRRAITDGDARLLGSVATASARINQRHLPVPQFDQLAGIASRSGGVGLQVAHSGDIAGLLFDREDPDMEGKMDHGAVLLREAGFARQWRFQVGGR